MIRPSFLRLMRDRSASAAVEIVLITPLLLIIATGAIELGNYFMDEHILLEGVRDGARYAARQNFSQYKLCTGTAAPVPTAVSDATKLIVRKGTLDSTANDLLPQWANATTFSVSMTCSATVGGAATGGIYNGNATGTSNVAPAVVVTATLPYRPVMASIGFHGAGLSITATQQAAVTGI